MTGAGNHTYLIVPEHGGEALLIDAGIGEPAHRRELVEQLHKAQATLAHILVTHGHRDHAGGATALASDHPEARFLKFPWSGNDDERHGVSWYPVADNQRVNVGDESLVILHTPGHSPDHIAIFHERTGTMFTGDLVLFGGSVLIPFSRGGDLVAYLASLERLMIFKPIRLLPAHGREIDQPGPIIQGALAHRLEREGQIVRALGRGLQTVSSIMESIYDGLPPALAAAAEENVRAHLDKLRREGRAEERDGRWIG